MGELRGEARVLADDDPDGFTAEHAASSLAGFQRGTLQARDAAEAADVPDPTTPHTDRS